MMKDVDWQDAFAYSPNNIVLASDGELYRSAELQLLISEEASAPQNRKCPTPKNQRKRKRKAQKKSRRAQRA